ncbi:hypothetical protein IF2G_00389 [Cordyceps javanica]|nr:hypothetical protein IF2G_00389 [Cordyceps javanica]
MLSELVRVVWWPLGWDAFHFTVRSLVTCTKGGVSSCAVCLPVSTVDEKGTGKMQEASHRAQVCTPYCTGLCVQVVQSKPWPCLAGTWIVKERRPWALRLRCSGTSRRCVACPTLAFYCILLGRLVGRMHCLALPCLALP